MKLKKEIVTLGVPGVDPNQRVGTYVEPRIGTRADRRSEVLLIDTRNDYEVAIGTFEARSIRRPSRSASSPITSRRITTRRSTRRSRWHRWHSLRKGLELHARRRVRRGLSPQGRHSQILEEVPEAQSRWKGDCFVFDNRVTVRHDLSAGEFDLCHACRAPLSVEDRQSEHYAAGISCPHCWDTLSEKTRAGARERQKQIELARQRNQPHPIGRDPREQ